MKATMSEMTSPEQNSRPKKRSWFRRLLGIVWRLWIAFVVIASMVIAITIGVAGGTLYSYYIELPDINRLENFRPSLVTKVFDRNKELIGEFFIEKRELITFEELPKDFINAVLATEDKRFWEHEGVDLIGFGRAMLVNLQNRNFSEGASTITQQLTRLLFLSPEKKIPRKVKEMMLAIKIEQKYRNLSPDKESAKKKIFELYANQYYWGHGAYGLRSAAKVYFGKEVAQLDLGECAMLAGILQRPNAHSPLRNPAQAKNRQKHVLDRMVVEGFISPEQADIAFQTPFVKQQIPERQINKAPYFVEYVRQYLEEQYGYRVYQEGLEVYTSVDLRLQDKAQELLQKHLRNLQKRYGFKLYDRDDSPEKRKERIATFQELEWRIPPKKGDLIHGIITEIRADKIVVQMGEYTGSIPTKEPSKLVKADDIILVNVKGVDEAQKTAQLGLDLEPIVEGALMAIDPRNGHVLAMVGGYDFYRSKFNRAVQALRQPGSSFKPFVYLTALERGFTPASVISDAPYEVVLDKQNGKTWTPKNFSSNFKGPVTLRQALANSLNVISAKLIMHVTPRAVVETARRLGITSYLNAYPSLALGASDVYLEEIVSAYCAFANRGYHVAPVFVTKVLDHDGNVLEENVPRARQAISEDINYLMVSMMKGVVEEGTAEAAKELGRPLAGKTGTTNDSTDAWFIGYSPSVVAGVWVGYDENRKSLGPKETGGKVALPIWIDLMREAHKDLPIEDFPVPSGISVVEIDAKTGLLAAQGCGETIRESFRKGTEPREYCYQYRGPLM